MKAGWDLGQGWLEHIGGRWRWLPVLQFEYIWVKDWEQQEEEVVERKRLGAGKW